MQNQRVAHAVDIDPLRRHADAQLWRDKNISKRRRWDREQQRDSEHCGTWMLPDAPLNDLLDVFDGLVVVLQAVVAQGNVVRQR